MRRAVLRRIPDLLGHVVPPDRTAARAATTGTSRPASTSHARIVGGSRERRERRRRRPRRASGPRAPTMVPIPGSAISPDEPPSSVHRVSRLLAWRRALTEQLAAGDGRVHQRLRRLGHDDDGLCASALSGRCARCGRAARPHRCGNTAWPSAPSMKCHPSAKPVTSARALATSCPASAGPRRRQTDHVHFRTCRSRRAGSRSPDGAASLVTSTSNTISGASGRWYTSRSASCGSPSRW